MLPADLHHKFLNYDSYLTINYLFTSHKFITNMQIAGWRLRLMTMRTWTQEMEGAVYIIIKVTYKMVS